MRVHQSRSAKRLPCDHGAVKLGREREPGEVQRRRCAVCKSQWDATFTEVPGIDTVMVTWEQVR